MLLSNTALVLIGFQNDYFSTTGILHNVVEASTKTSGVIEKTVKLLEHIGPSFGAVFTTPILFTRDYSELKEPVGILKSIKELGAFQRGTNGVKTIDQLLAFTPLIREVPGKRGLNAFSNTQLDDLLISRGISHIVLAGAVTSVCIDSTGRDAAERGYDVTILSDCTSGRTEFEQDFYCQQIFPIYARVKTSRQLIDDNALATRGTYVF